MFKLLEYQQEVNAMIDTVLVLGLYIALIVLVSLGALLVWGLVLISIMLEDLVRCQWFGGNGELGSDRKKAKKELNQLKK